MKKKVLYFSHELIAALVLLAAFFGAAAAAGPWAGVAEKIDSELRAVLKLYEGGKVQAAEEKAVDAYFGIFEGEKANMEIAIRQNLSFKRANELEKAFSEIRKAMHKKNSAAAVKALTVKLSDGIGKAADELDGKGVGLNTGWN